jgi:putative FmdB family regulatory protein
VPIYDYVCASCGHVVEVIHAISAPGPAACERCGGAMKRALSAPAIVFKGSGWAKKDARDASRSKVSAPATGAETPAADGAASGATTTEGPAGEKPAASGASDGAGSTTTTTSTTTGGSGAAAG